MRGRSSAPACACGWAKKKQNLASRSRTPSVALLSYFAPKDFVIIVVPSVTMPSDLEDQEPDLLATISTAADAIAAVLTSERPKAGDRWHRTSEGEESKELRMRLCFLYLERLRIRDQLCILPGERLNAHLEEIATRMDSLIDDHYLADFQNSRTNDLGSGQHKRLEDFVIAHETQQREPVKFEEARAIRISAAKDLSRLLSALRSFFHTYEELDSQRADPTEAYQTPAVDSVSTISFNSFRGPNNVKTLAERLHWVLHKGRPCILEEHVDGHVGALGDCTHARMQLDPRWIMQGIEDGCFFIVLSGDGIDQECEVCLTKTHDPYVDEL